MSNHAHPDSNEEKAMTKVESKEDIDAALDGVEAALDGVEAMLEEEANRPLSDSEQEALDRIKRKLDDQLAALERK